CRGPSYNRKGPAFRIPRCTCPIAALRFGPAKVLPMTSVRHVTVALALLPASALAAFAITPRHSATKPAVPISYYRSIRPIFQEHGRGCHQRAKAQGGLAMTSHAGLLARTDHDEPGILPGHPEASAILDQITPHAGKPPTMPRGAPALPGPDVELIAAWI